MLRYTHYSLTMKYIFFGVQRFIFNLEKPDVFNTYGGNLPYNLCMMLDVLCPTGVITFNYIETARSPLGNGLLKLRNRFFLVFFVIRDLGLLLLPVHPLSPPVSVLSRNVTTLSIKSSEHPFSI